jgi:hypothetical protein
LLEAAEPGIAFSELMDWDNHEGNADKLKCENGGKVSARR